MDTSENDVTNHTNKIYPPRTESQKSEVGITIENIKEHQGYNWGLSIHRQKFQEEKLKMKP